MQPVIPFLDQFRAHVRDESAFALLNEDLRALQDVLREQGAPVAVGLGLHPSVGDAAPEPGIVAHVLWGELSDLNLPTQSANGFAIHVEVIAQPSVEAKGAAQRELVQSAPTDAFRQAYARPPGGVSIGLAGMKYSGTLGCYLKSGDQYFLLTSRNVLDPNLSGQVAPWVQQQSFQDGNRTNRSIAQTRYVASLQTRGANQANAGVALLTTDAFNSRILIGPDTYASLAPTNALLSVGDSVKKSGRTTGLTSSVVMGLGVQVPVMMPDGKMYTFADCIAVAQSGGSFQQVGDAGALLMNEAGQAVGLLFATSYDTAYATPIAAVLAALKAASGLDFEVVTG